MPPNFSKFKKDLEIVTGTVFLYLVRFELVANMR
jgi:hypothetical protein